MLRGILIVVLVVALCVGGWMLYKQYNPSASFGDVTARNNTSEKAATTDLDGNATTTYDENAGPPQGASGASNQPPADKKAAIASGSGTEMTTGQVEQPQNGGQNGTTITATPASLPVSDSIAPNPPNGAVFAGTGKFTWYRQGNITWRVNSASGSACIAFATMDEWQKPIVYTHGCGNA